MALLHDPVAGLRRRQEVEEERARGVSAPPPAWGVTPVFDPLVISPPDAIRKELAKWRDAGWLVWYAVRLGRETGRGWLLAAAYRDGCMVNCHWEQDATLAWKPKGGSHWRGRVPLSGKLGVTALKKIIHNQT